MTTTPAVPDVIALFDDLSASGCSYGALCCHPTDAGMKLNECKVCHDKRVHHLCCCVTCPVVCAVVSEIDMGSYCFDCAAMLGITQTSVLVNSIPVQNYYAQIGWAEEPQPQTSRTIGALMAMKPRPLLTICDGAEDADPLLLLCSFCNVAVHNSVEYLGSLPGGTVLPAQAAANSDADWSCPMCWSAALSKAKSDALHVAGRKRTAPRGSGGGGGGRKTGSRGGRGHV